MGNGYLLPGFAYNLDTSKVKSHPLKLKVIYDVLRDKWPNYQIEPFTFLVTSKDANNNFEYLLPLEQGIKKPFPETWEYVEYARLQPRACYTYLSLAIYRGKINQKDNTVTKKPILWLEKKVPESLEEAQEQSLFWNSLFEPVLFNHEATKDLILKLGKSYGKQYIQSPQ